MDGHFRRIPQYYMSQGPAFRTHFVACMSTAKPVPNPCTLPQRGSLINFAVENHQSILLALILSIAFTRLH
jgi:hypothetical protein